VSPLGPAAGQGRSKDCFTSSSDPMMEGPMCRFRREKHEPASDVATVVVDSLKALDPNRPIREADIGLPLIDVRFTPNSGHRSARS